MMLRIGSTLALAAALLCAGLVPVRAQTPGGAPIAGSASGYSVDNVAVEATAGNATEARAKAFAQGPRKGLQQLLQQIGADPARVSGMSDADVERLVQSFQVKSEQASPGHYSANLAYTFRSSGVQQLLAGGGTAPPVTATLPGAVPGTQPQPGAAPGFEARGSVTVTVPIAAPADWYDVQGRLTRLGGMVSSSLVSLTARQAVLELRFPGDQTQLNQILSQQGLTVQQGAQALELHRAGGM
ncbi:hypothetical protein FFK22_032310 [Mycobacterium sp. KBS0706]|uniref:hypothetical protein n=1 Tax=Mycobacterium sp. KBS0706 TaxID=2578109 RepID=UPI00110F6BC1|nr:hypothetical protein [Mycobacterium sp. KBS0706]TSD84482.1 hypothetical protein FFK22_032310 [Mycobacterium sp. KBS0706]